MLDIVGSLLQRKNFKLSARIPLPTSLRSATFPPGEGIGAAAPQQPSNRAINCNLPQQPAEQFFVRQRRVSIRAIQDRIHIFRVIFDLLGIQLGRLHQIAA